MSGTRVLQPVVWAVICLVSVPAFGQDPAATAVRFMTPEVDAAVTRGLTYLETHQNRDGSFGSGDMRGNVAVTALAGIAFMAEGSQPNRGRYGTVVDRALGYLLANVQSSGYIAHGPEDQMYGHGFATMFLAECYGTSQRPDLREKLSRAVRLIVNTQNSEGGWRYQPQRLGADISVTICQVMALRAAKNAGIHVPRETVERCIEYVRKCQNPDGGFRYMLTSGDSAFARSAAGVTALYSAGVYEGEELEAGLRYLMQFVPQPGEVARESYFYYGHYYCVQAMWQAGGSRWTAYYPAIRDELLARQLPDGSWSSPFSPEYGTAMACIILQVPNNCLPIFER
ncbi:MAG: prenyltransferase [Planctomycetota bacterium]|nr:MAG: prenyltransferase [Planctomycetota bacterium]